MGRLSFEPTMIHVVGLSEGPNDNPEATIIGGQNVCFKVHGSVGKIEVRFPYPNLGPGEEPSEWTTSFPVKINSQENSYELFIDRNQATRDKSWAETGWHYMWKFEPVSAFCRRKSQWLDCPDPGG
jgi:hypothetical protein